MNLLLARGVARRREIGIRLAIGASRGRLVEQLLIESLLIAVLGGVAGYALAYVLPTLVPRLIPVPDLQLNLTPDGRILAIALTLSAATALVFGLVPALHATNMDLVAASRGAVQSRAARGHVRTSRLRSAIVAVQVAGSGLLLIASMLFVRAARHAASVDPGYAMQNVVSFGLNLTQLGYSSERIQATYEMLRERIAASPEVAAAGLLVPLPLLGRHSESVQMRQGGKDVRIDDVSLAIASSGALQTLDLPIVAGRAYTDAEARANGATSSVVVSEALAEVLVPSGSAVGSMLTINNRPFAVTGIAANTRYTSIAKDAERFIWMAPSALRSNDEMYLVARTRGRTAELERAFTRWVKEMDPNVVVRSEPLSARLDLAIKPVRIASAVAGAVGMLAMFLALVGIYGVVSYAVSQQTREIAIRQALGATRRAVVQSVMRQGSSPIVIGILTALALSLVVGRVIRALLLGVSPLDPVTYGGVIGLLLLASAAAMYAPARRAARISPAAALRED
jgi:predicted permease